MRSEISNSVTILVITFFHLSWAGIDGNEKFGIDFKQDTFLKNGLPYRECSGEMHYFRIPHQYWKDRLIKLKKMGLNTVQTYISWAFHEPVEGTFRFKGDYDFVRFIQIAKELDIYVDLRYGPYINAERDLGGLPSWLLAKTNKTRQTDPVYQDAVANWLDKILPMVKPYLYATNNGPITMVQVENEYGFQKACDKKYLNWLRDLTRKHLGPEVVLYTTDNPIDSDLECGIIDKVFATVDFGVGTDPSVPFGKLRNLRSKGPLVNSEFYVGFFDTWTVKHETRATADVVRDLERVLTYKNKNTSVSIYMFHGGTTFGLQNGAAFTNGRFYAQIGSYDYDAPLNEAGDPTDKYYALQKLFHNKCLGKPVPEGKKLEVSPKMGTDVIKLTPFMDLYQFVRHGSTKKSQNPRPQSFEELGVSYGYVLYTTKMPDDSENSELVINGLADRATIYVDKVYQGTLSRTEEKYSLKIKGKKGSSIDIFVENQGRLSNGPSITDRKGILRDVKLNGKILKNWDHAFVKNWEDIFDHSSPMRDALKLDANQTRISKKDSKSVPTFLRANFVLPKEGPVYDTYLLPKNLIKGVVYLNNRCLGKYWLVEGPQVTLYTPGVWLRPSPQENEIIIFESDPSPCVKDNNCEIQFIKKPIIDAPTRRSKP
ncbi:beta-galactosidase-like [Brevipalpus obovatus]|uniref:beta-galactosidase-like n=1 Tax=Brevipalpus obovatus TaxID=246614 RepID=UPI003D9F6FE7